MKKRERDSKGKATRVSRDALYDGVTQTNQERPPLTLAKWLIRLFVSTEPKHNTVDLEEVDAAVRTLDGSKNPMDYGKVRRSAINNAERADDPLDNHTRYEEK